ncbi:hypothetical protein GNF82_13990 [Clostridium perfringens]
MLVNKGNAQRLKKVAVEEIDPRGNEITGALYNQFNEFHSQDTRTNKDIERLLLKQKQLELDVPDAHTLIQKGLTIFSPSSVSECPRELFYKAVKATRDKTIMHPYQRRWVRNGLAVHEFTQRDLLYMEKTLENPLFTVARTEDGLPKWESNIKTHKVIEHNGEKFAMFGMMDGELVYTSYGSNIGFEFKTKSTTIAQVGTFKMKDAQDGHKLQTVAYAILFDLEEFILMYESVAKDNWSANANAKPDIRTFYNKVTEEDKTMLLDKLADVQKHIREGRLPEGDLSKRLFCPYKTSCSDWVL